MRGGRVVDREESYCLLQLAESPQSGPLLVSGGDAVVAVVAPAPQLVVQLLHTVCVSVGTALSLREKQRERGRDREREGPPWRESNGVRPMCR